MANKRRKKNEPPPLPKFSGFRPLSDRKELRDQLEAKKAEALDRFQVDASSKRGTVGAGLKPAPTKTAPQPPRTPPAPDDELTFHRMMSGVAPLDLAGVRRVPVTTDAIHSRLTENANHRVRTDAAEVRDHLHNLVDATTQFEVMGDGKRVEGRRVDTPPGLLRNLRRGMLPIDAELDLHGLTTPEASERLIAFLRQMCARGERCVLIIHGKGDHRPGGGVLRGEVVTWLSQGRARKYVAAFATAVGRDGGEGAVYVALWR